MDVSRSTRARPAIDGRRDWCDRGDPMCGDQEYSVRQHLIDTGGRQTIDAPTLGVERERQRELADLGPDPGELLLALGGAEGSLDQAGDLAHLGLTHAARRHRRRSDANAARDEGRLRLAGNRVLV